MFNTGYSVIKNSMDADGAIAVFDTYEYIMHLLIKGNITSKSELVTVNNETKSKIIMTYPSSYTVNSESPIKVKITYKDVELKKNRHSVEFNLSMDQDVIVETMVTYTDGIGDIPNANSRYIAKLYSDIPNSDVWYYDYVYTATNKKIINGYDEENIHFFRPAPKENQSDDDTYGKITRGEFLKIVMSAIGYPVDSPANEKLWAEEHIERANKMGALLDYKYNDYPANLDDSGKLSYQNTILTRKFTDLGNAIMKQMGQYSKCMQMVSLTVMKMKQLNLIDILQGQKLAK